MVNPQDLPVMCTLAPETLAARKAALLPGLVARADRVEPLPDGIRLRFAATELPAIASVIESERQCCRFLRFEIVVQPGAGPIEVTLTGPPGTRDFVDALISG